VVATDTGRHETDVVSALSSCCDVLVEKPMAVDAPAAMRMVESAERHGSRLNVASCLRFDAGLQWVRDRLTRVGPIATVEVECLSWLPGWRPDRDYRATYAARSGEGGVLRDLIHEIDYALWLFGPMDLTGAELANSGRLGLPADVEEAAVLHARVGAGRATMAIRLDFASKDESRFLRVVGSDGELVWDYRSGVAQLLSTGGDVCEVKRWDTRRMYESQIDAWLGELGGRPNPDLSTASDGVAALAVCDDARAKSRWVSGQS
jgi:predicted dehydrogenase